MGEINSVTPRPQTPAAAALGGPIVPTQPKPEEPTKPPPTRSEVVNSFGVKLTDNVGCLEYNHQNRQTDINSGSTNTTSFGVSVCTESLGVKLQRTF